MAKDKKSFILYCDQKGIWDKLDNEQAGKLIKHILAYVNDENQSSPDFITELAFEPIKQQLKSLFTCQICYQMGYPRGLQYPCMNTITGLMAYHSLGYNI